MSSDPQHKQMRTPERIRARSKRLGLLLAIVAVVFFASIVVKQWLFVR